MAVKDKDGVVFSSKKGNAMSFRFSVLALEASCIGAFSGVIASYILGTNPITSIACVSAGHMITLVVELLAQRIFSNNPKSFAAETAQRALVFGVATVLVLCPIKAISCFPAAKLDFNMGVVVLQLSILVSSMMLAAFPSIENDFRQYT